MFKATCKVCNRTHSSDNINGSILDLKHHPECDASKHGISVEYDIKDSKFS